ncbi:MAG: hypothetical protein AVDCRST_MAG79-1093, partial [uncultured Thermoleophilia bacterium]
DRRLPRAQCRDRHRSLRRRLRLPPALDVRLAAAAAPAEPLRPRAAGAVRRASAARGRRAAHRGAAPRRRGRRDADGPGRSASRAARGRAGGAPRAVPRRAGRPTLRPLVLRPPRPPAHAGVAAPGADLRLHGPGRVLRGRAARRGRGRARALRVRRPGLHRRALVVRRQARPPPPRPPVPEQRRPGALRPGARRPAGAARDGVAAATATRVVRRHRGARRPGAPRRAGPRPPGLADRDGRPGGAARRRRPAPRAEPPLPRDAPLRGAARLPGRVGRRADAVRAQPVDDVHLADQDAGVPGGRAPGRLDARPRRRRAVRQRRRGRDRHGRRRVRGGRRARARRRREGPPDGGRGAPRGHLVGRHVGCDALPHGRRRGGGRRRGDGSEAHDDHAGSVRAGAGHHRLGPTPRSSHDRRHVRPPGPVPEAGRGERAVRPAAVPPRRHEGRDALPARRGVSARGRAGGAGPPLAPEHAALGARGGGGRGHARRERADGRRDGDGLIPARRHQLRRSGRPGLREPPGPRDGQPGAEHAPRRRRRRDRGRTGGGGGDRRATPAGRGRAGGVGRSDRVGRRL